MRTLVTLTVGLLLLAPALARAQGVVLPLPPEDQQNITAQLGAGLVGAALPSNPINDRDDLKLTKRRLKWLNQKSLTS